MFGESLERKEGIDNCKIDRKLAKPMTDDAYSSFNLHIWYKCTSLYMTYAAIHIFMNTVLLWAAMHSGGHLGQYCTFQMHRCIVGTQWTVFSEVFWTLMLVENLCCSLWYESGLSLLVPFMCVRYYCAYHELKIWTKEYVFKPDSKPLYQWLHFNI